MFLKSLSRYWKSISFQLTAWYSGIFVLTFALFFIVAFVFLQSSLKRRDREFITDELSEHSARYNLVGVDKAINEIKFETGITGSKPFFVRVANLQNHTIYLSAPPQWEDFDLTQLEREGTNPSQTWIQLPKKNDEDVMDVASARLKDGNVMQVGMGSGVRNEQLEKFWMIIGLLLPVALMSIFAGLFLSFRALRPIRHLIRIVHSVADTGNMDARVPIRQSGDEMDELANLFNRMFDRVNLLIRGMKESLDNVAHDLRTPLMRLWAVSEEALQSEPEIERYQDALVLCLEESQQLVTMLKALMDISEAETGTLKLQLQDVDASELIQEVVNLYQVLADEKKMRVTLKLADNLHLQADRMRVRQALANIFDNALKYTPDGGSIEIESSQQDNSALITVKDSGVGIFPIDLPKIWDRLYRGDHSRSTPGLGLGLSMVKAIANAHHGKVDVTSTPGKGAIFFLYLPLAPSVS